MKIRSGHSLLSLLTLKACRADDTPLFGEEGLGLDSIDALELGMAVKKRFGVNLSGTTEENRSRFASVKTLADYIRTQKPEA